MVPSFGAVHGFSLPSSSKTISCRRLRYSTIRPMMWKRHSITQRVQIDFLPLDIRPLMWKQH